MKQQNSANEMHGDLGGDVTVSRMHVQLEAQDTTALSAKFFQSEEITMTSPIGLTRWRHCRYLGDIRN